MQGVGGCIQYLPEGMGAQVRPMLASHDSAMRNVDWSLSSMLKCGNQGDAPAYWGTML